MAGTAWQGPVARCCGGVLSDPDLTFTNNHLASALSIAPATQTFHQVLQAAAHLAECTKERHLLAHHEKHGKPFVNKNKLE
jgi:hypothetical protein